MAQALNFNVSNPDLPGLGKLGLSGTNTTGFTAYFKVRVLIQSTEVVPATTIATGITNGSPYSNYAIPIPTDASTERYMSGVYTVEIKAYKTAGDTLLNTYTETFGFGPYADTRTSELSLAKSTNGTEGYFTITDETTYRDANDTTVQKYWTVTEPTVMAVPGGTITGTDNFIKVYFNYVNVAYQIYLKVNISYNVSDDVITVTESHQLTSNFTYFIDVQNNLCEVKQCLYDTLASLEAQSCQLGGFDKLSASDRQKWFALQQYLAGWQVADGCNDVDSRQAYFLKIKALLKCECEENTDVAPFILPDGSQQVQTNWVEVTTSFLNSFVNYGLLPLRWRIDRDNRLHLTGRIQVPNGLVGQTTITTGWIPSDRVASVMPIIKYEVFDVNGDPIGAIRVDTDTDLTFTPNSAYTGVEFVNINVLIPLDATV